MSRDSGIGRYDGFVEPAGELHHRVCDHFARVAEIDRRASTRIVGIAAAPFGDQIEQANLGTDRLVCFADIQMEVNAAHWVEVDIILTQGNSVDLLAAKAPQPRTLATDCARGESSFDKKAFKLSAQSFANAKP